MRYCLCFSLTLFSKCCKYTIFVNMNTSRPDWDHIRFGPIPTGFPKTFCDSPDKMSSVLAGHLPDILPSDLEALCRTFSKFAGVSGEFREACPKLAGFLNQKPIKVTVLLYGFHVDKTSFVYKCLTYDLSGRYGSHTIGPLFYRQ